MTTSGIDEESSGTHQSPRVDWSFGRKWAPVRILIMITLPLEIQSSSTTWKCLNSCTPCPQFSHPGLFVPCICIISIHGWLTSTSDTPPSPYTRQSHPCRLPTSWPNDVRVWVLKEYRFIVFSTGKWLQGENDTEFLSAKVSYRFLESITAQKKSLNRAGWKHCSKPFKVSALPVPLLWHTALFEECNWWMHWCDAALVMLAPYKSHVEKRTASRETSPSKIHNQHA